MKKTKKILFALLVIVFCQFMNAQQGGGILKNPPIKQTPKTPIYSDLKAELEFKKRYTKPSIKNCVLTFYDIKTAKRIDFATLKKQISNALYTQILTEHKLIGCVPNPENPDTPQTISGLKVDGNTLKDGCGKDLVLRGVNLDVEKALWSNWQNNLNLLTTISNTGSNTVRIPWWATSTNGASAAYTLDKLEAYLQKCKELELVPILELHDVTCSNDVTAFENKIMAFWLRHDVKTLLQKHQNYLIINFANEFGFVEWTQDKAIAKRTYIDSYKSAISRMRSNGYTCPLLVDASECGANEVVLLEVCNEIFNADYQGNTLFSVHAYWVKYKNQLGTINTQITAMKNSGHCFLLGEVANYQASESSECVYNIDVNGASIMETVLLAAKNNNIGWIAWEWYNDSCPNRNLTTDGNLTTLTPQGNKILNDSRFGISKSTNIKACTN